MTQQDDVRRGALPPLPGAARGFIRWVCTKNPFYVISAGLFLAGLKISFGNPLLAEDTYAMMGGLAGYTLLLAGAACLLVRFANVWDDVRTVLLLVVLMFLATSVTFDEVLVQTPERGLVVYLTGLAFATAVSESILRVIRLKLPAGFRLPYYVILGLFFLYPLALQSYVRQPNSEILQWGLFAFSSVAGLLFLTLLPAIRRGPAYVRGNGSPWPWPQYPWSLFVFLAVAVVGRSYLLCWSMHLLEQGNNDQLIFGPYFLIPFGFVIAVLLLELGLTSRSRITVNVALALPMMLVLLALVGHRHELMYQRFLNLFTSRLGALPAYVSLITAIAFYGMAMLRRVPWATEGVTAALAVLAVVGPNTLDLQQTVLPRPAPLLTLAALQLALGIWQRVSWRCLVGCLAMAAGLAVSGEWSDWPLRGPLALHAALLAMLLLGALFDDAFAKLLRAAGVLGLLAASLSLMLLPLDMPADVPTWTLWLYPLTMTILLAGYALLLRDRLAWSCAAGVLVCWLATGAWQGYVALRQRIVGQDYLTLGLVFLAIAVLTSLAKSGALTRWKLARRGGAEG